MKTSRSKLLEFIRAHPPVTCSEISTALKMTAANARHHLMILQEQGLVEVVGMRPSHGKGRPAQLYSLSQQALGNNLLEFTNAMLEETRDQLAPSDFKLFLHAVAERMAEKLSPFGGSRKMHIKELHLTQRLFETVQQLNARRYQARWEAHAEAPRLILNHCPYGDLPMVHSEICQLDALLIETLLGSKVTLLTKLKPDGRGLKNCVFRLA